MMTLRIGNRESGIGKAEADMLGTRVRVRSAHSPFPIPHSRRAKRAAPALILPRRAGEETNARSALFYKSGGFTLLEMLAVIVLIGIIGAVVVTQVGKNVDKGKYGAGKAQLMTLSQKIENYSLDNGSAPQQLSDLITKPANAANWQGPYSKESGLKDPWGHAFGYQSPGEHGAFDLVFYGQDGKPGGDGYSKDWGNWQ
jgi:general secretion pathway protein G